MILRAVAVALAITAIHTTLVASTSGQEDPTFAWLALFKHDGGWFKNILEVGYRFPPTPSKADPGNVAFFPAYQLAARGLMALLDMPLKPALLLAAQLACVGFWVYFQLLLKQWGTPPLASVACVGLVAGHPGAFFLVCSYSESTFLFGLAGFLYWSNRTGPTAGVLAVIHGIVLTAGRLVGAPVVVYPILRAWAQRATIGGYFTATVIATGAALGFVAYALYLHFAFGRWDAFAITHEVGWDVHPDALAFFRLRTWALRYTEFFNVWWDVAALDRLFVPITVLHFLILGRLEWLARRGGRDSHLRGRLPLYVISFALFVVPVISHSTRGLSSLTRFALCWDVVLVLSLAGLLADRKDWMKRRWVVVMLFAGVGWFASVQVTLAYKFTHNVFVG